MLHKMSGIKSLTIILSLLFIIYLPMTIGVSIDFANNVQFLLYTKNNQKYPQQLFIGDSNTLSLSDFKSIRKTKIIIHEWGTGQRSINTIPIRQAYLKYSDFNIIVIDWHKYALLSYPASRKLIGNIGKHIGQFLQFLISQGHAKSSDMYIIGYGLGAHVAGNVGKIVRTLTRITALNPEINLFSKTDIDILKNDDAKFVDVLLTNEKDSLTIDNMGILTIFILSNKNDTSAGKYYAETIVNSICMKAVRCNSLEYFNNGLCSANEGICIGENIPLNTSGQFYVKVQK